MPTEADLASREHKVQHHRDVISKCDQELRKHNLKLAKYYPNLSNGDIDYRLQEASVIVRKRAASRSALTRLGVEE